MGGACTMSIRHAADTGNPQARPRVAPGREQVCQALQCARSRLGRPFD